MRVAVVQARVGFLERRFPITFLLDPEDDGELLSAGELVRGFDIPPQLAAFFEPARRGRDGFGAFSFDEQNSAVGDEATVDVGEALERPPLVPTPLGAVCCELLHPLGDRFIAASVIVRR